MFRYTSCRLLLAFFITSNAYLFSTYAYGATNLALKQFNQEFATKIREAQAKKQEKRLNQLANTMINKAKGIKKKNPHYAILLCERTYTISARSRSRMKQAAQAAKLLIELKPEQERAALEKLARVYLLAYQNLKKYDPRYKTAGRSLSEMFIRISWLKAVELDQEGATRDIQRAASIANASNQQHLVDQASALEKRIPDIVAFERHVAEAKSKLTISPRDKIANETIAFAYLVFQDDPEAALPYAKIGFKPEDYFRIQLADEPLGKVNAESYLDLAIWYMGHAMKYKSEVKHRISMAIRARLYAEYYISQLEKGLSKGIKADGEIIRDRAKELAMSTGISSNDFDNQTGDLAMLLGTVDSQAYRKAMASVKTDFNQGGTEPVKKPETIAAKPIKNTPEIENKPIQESQPVTQKPKSKLSKAKKRSITQVEPPKFKGPGDGSTPGGRSIFDF